MHKLLLKILIFSIITFNIFAETNPIIPQLIPDSSLVGKGKYTFLFMKIFDNVFDEILETVGTVTNIDRVYYFEVNEEKRVISQKYEWTH